MTRRLRLRIARSPVALAWALGCALVGAPGVAAAQERTKKTAQEEAFEARSFSIPNTQYAKSLYERAQAHLAARRWSEALADLQQLLEEHRGDVLPGRNVDSAGHKSQQPLHPGAAEAARRRLLELPAEARKLYADRYGGAAEEALGRARRSLDRAALVEVARRWPITPAASRAWLSLGDLELELGNLEAARGAWSRAGELGVADIAAAARTRLAWAGSTATTRAPQGAEAGAASANDPSWTPTSSADFRLPGPGEARGNPPGPDCHSWPVPVRIEEDGPFSSGRSGETFNLFPVVWGDAVLVSNTMRLWAIDAFSGEVRWKSDEAPGWSAVRSGELTTGKSRRSGSQVINLAYFFEGIDRESLLVAPAAAAGIAVAALQIPITHVGNTMFQRQIKITTVIPDRRLFAFDIASGRLLWSHLPPPGWDGEAGTFSERMRVAGPPVISGTRVLVPAYRMQGRIDYHVACYDLFSGECLWSTAVIGGQRPLNMFGRPEKEFAAPPLRVEGDQVLALTQLGAVASLDLYTGEIQWETLYDQIALPTADGIQAGERPRVWKNAPPVVSGKLVVATPVDCLDVLGLDLDTGALLWTYASRELSETRMRYGVNLALIGASEDTLYFAGSKLQALQAVGGLQTGKTPMRLTRSKSVLGNDYGASSPLPRPVLAERHVLVPGAEGRIALDRFDLGREDPQFSGPWSEERRGNGNAVLSRGALYVLSNQTLTAFFDWQTVEERLSREVQKAPADAQLAARYGGFLKERAEAELALARPRNALSYCVRARAVLEPLLEGSPAIAERLHQVLRLEARVLLDDADSDLALQRLTAAKAIAPDRASLRDTLLEMIALQETRDRPKWFALLDELDGECGELLLPSRTAAEAVDGIGRAGSDSNPLASDAVSDASPAAGSRASSTTIGLWVLFQKTREHARTGAIELEFADLHQILERFGNVALPVLDQEEPQETASLRIARRLEQGHAAAYGPYELRASALLARALAEDDRPMLQRIPELYPQSAAARQAREARLKAAFADRDIATVAEVVLAELSPQWTPAASTPRETQLALVLARTLQESGNLSFGADLLAALAREQPDLASEIPEDRGRTLADLARSIPKSATAEWLPETSTFAPPSASLDPLRGNALLLGSLLAPSSGRRPPSEAGPGGTGREPATPADSTKGEPAPPERLLVFVSTDKLFAISSADPAHQLWWMPLDGRTSTKPSGWRDTALVASERVVLAEDREVRGINALSGELSWVQRFEEEILYVEGASGVCVLSLSSLDGRPTRLVGLELATGVPLWSQPLTPDFWPAPVCGEGRFVLLPKPSSGRRGVVRQLATGTGGLTLEFDLGVAAEDRRGAWIENDLLVLPRFSRSGLPTSDAVVAYDLVTGRRAWRVAADDQRELDSIVRCGDAYLILNGSSSTEHAQSGIVLQLDTRLGAVRQVQGVQLFAGDLPIGVSPNTVTELQAPYLFLRSPAPGGRETLVRAIHLPFGQRWVHRLPLAEQDILSQLMPLPALSETTVAIVYTEESRTRPGRTENLTQLVLLDKSSGLPRGSQVLETALGPAQTISLHMLGNALLIGGRDQLSIFQRTDRTDQR
jgi:outer membrane protein assembly factor BamB/tetratricopeptide (TPR) repeat protein